MSRGIVVVTLSIGLASLASAARAQGLAEYSTLTGAMSSATTKAAGTLGNATNGAATRVADRVATPTTKPAAVPAAKRHATPAPRAVLHLPAAPVKPMGPSKMQIVSATPSPRTVGGDYGLAAKPAAQDKYPSSITLGSSQ